MKFSLLPWSLVVWLLVFSSFGLFLLAAAENIAANDRLRGQDGSLSLLIAVPLSQDNKPLPDPGIFQLAAALLAVDHFNTRNLTVVQELDGHEVLRNCPIQFGSSTASREDEDDGTTTATTNTAIQVVDTGVNSHQAMGQIVTDLLLQQRQSTSSSIRTTINIPDAIAGPYHAIPALELSVLATGLQSPLVSHRSSSSSGSDSSDSDSSSSSSTTVSDLLLLDPHYNPYYHQVTADWNAEMNFLARFLQHYNRTNYVAIVYNSYSGNSNNTTKTNTASAVYQSVVSAKVDRLQFLLEEQYGMDHVTAFRYIPSRHMSDIQKEKQQAIEQQAAMHASSNPNYHTHNQKRLASSSEDCRTVLQNVKETGYRTIVLVSESLIQDVSDIEQSVHEMGLDQGNHFWVLPMSSSGSSTAANATGAQSSASSQQQPPAVVEMELFIQSQAVTQLEDSSPVQAYDFLKGAAFLLPHDGYYHPPQQSPNGRVDFRSSLLNHDSGLFHRVLDHLPDSYQLDEELFKFLLFVANDTTNSTQPPLARLAQYWNSWLAGAAFMYDAVMSIGLGACAAAVAANSNSTMRSTTMTGIQHRNGIRSVNFMGASGHIQFGGPNGPPGSRVGSTVPFAVINFVQDYDQKGLIVARQTETLDTMTGNWIQLEYPFVFADGTHNPPPLREIPPQNYITKAAKISGICLFVISLAVVLASVVWVFVNRHDPVVVAGQPVFLYTLCFASILLCFLILISLFDETWGFSQEGLDAACCAWTWFDAQGRTIAYSALFTKLWIVNRCLRYKTRDLARWRIIWPVALVIFTTTLFLTIWQIQGDFGWVRQEVDEVTGASAGFCLESPSSGVYLLPIYALQIATVLAAGIMAWKTIGMDDLYSDSKWVLGLILVQFQVLIVGGPTIAMLKDVDPTMKYLGLALLTFTFPVSAMGLIIFPKILVVRRKRRKGEECCDGSDSSPPPRESPQEERDTSAHSANNNNERTGGRLARQNQQGLPRNGPRIQIVTFD